MIERKIKNIADTINDFYLNSIFQKNKIRCLIDKNGVRGIDKFLGSINVLKEVDGAIKSFEFFSNKYFEKNEFFIICGLLQCMVLQQDAVQFIKECIYKNDKNIINTPIYNKKTKSGVRLKEIRGFRVLIAGHPVVNYKGITSFLDYFNLNSDNITVICWDKNGPKTKKENIIKIIKDQDVILCVELNKILKKMKREEKNHKNKFKSESLYGLFVKKTKIYSIEVIRNLFNNDSSAWPSFLCYLKQYNIIKKKIFRRYGKIKTNNIVPSIDMLFCDLDYIFKKIQLFKKRKNSPNKIEFDIYIDALKNKIEKLKNILKEVDEDFFEK